MLFRLIVLLTGGLFLAMYFVPEGARAPKPPRPASAVTAEAPEPAAEPAPAAEGSADGQTAGQTSGQIAPRAGSGSLPPVPASPAQDVVPAPAPLVAPAETAEAPEATPPEGEGEAADPFAAADPAEPPLDPGAALPELGQLGASGNSDALSLSESVRARTEAEGVTPPPVRPGSQTATGAATDPAIGAAAAPAAPAHPPVGPVTGPRAQVTATSVNLRAAPSTGASVVGRVNFGDTVVVSQPNAAPGWTGIRNPRTGEVAYVSSQFLQMVP